MLITLFSVLISLFLVFYAPPPSGFDVQFLTVVILTGGTIIFLATSFLHIFLLTPLSTLERKLIPRLMRHVAKDFRLRVSRFVLFVFVLISFFCVALVSRVEPAYVQDWFFVIWMVLFGVALDVFRDSLKRFTHLLSTDYLVRQRVNEAIGAIRSGRTESLLSDIDDLSVIATTGVEKSQLSLSSLVLQNFPSILKAHFESVRSIGQPQEQEMQKPENGDETSFVLFYLLQRLELINDKALKERQETICRQMVMVLGKIIQSAAQLDLSMVSFPTHFLTKFGLKSQQHYFDEVGQLTESTLLEVARSILTEINITYAELIEPFKSIINGLAALTRAEFKKRKETNISVLIDPFKHLRQMFQNEKVIRHRDTPAILQLIDGCIEEFSVLQQGLQSLPSIAGEMPQEQSKDEIRTSSRPL